ncbi:MAG: homoserine kinase [Balneolaceae bacterium]
MNRSGTEWIRVFAPATVANVGCGFDVLGFAIDGPGDEVLATLDERPGVVIDSIDGAEDRLPLAPEKNTGGRGVQSLLKALGREETGIRLRIHKKMPLGSGLGSSAASAVASVVAANELLGAPLKREELLPHVVEGEVAASGTAHADNVAASLLGGFVLVRSDNPPDVISLDYPKDLCCTIIHPKIEIETRNTRMILRKEVSMANAIQQWANVGALVAGLYKGDYDLIGRSLQDRIVEPIRSVLIPGYDRMKNRAMEAGAIGFSISGAGPSVFALCRSLEQAQEIGESAGSVLEEMDLEYDLHLSPVNHKGSYILERGES